MRTLFPRARLGHCLRHAINKLPGKLVALASPLRKALRSRLHTGWRTKGGLVCGVADPLMPVTSTLLDQAHNAIDRKLFMMQGFHHPDGSQQAFLRGLAQQTGSSKTRAWSASRCRDSVRRECDRCAGWARYRGDLCVRSVSRSIVYGSR